MNFIQNTVIIIPARLGSTRLHNKPLQKIGEYTLIEHTYLSVKKVKLDNIYVATDSNLIAEVIEKHGGNVLLTSESCPSGTDRVYESLFKIPNFDTIKYIINIQGDLPFISPKIIQKIIDYIKMKNFDIVTPIVKINYEIAKESRLVKVVFNRSTNKAIYFSRQCIPYNASEFWGHIGIYGFTQQSLKKFANLPESILEKTEKLEQLRAIENNINIGVCCVEEEFPLSVDTQEDLEIARNFWNK